MLTAISTSIDLGRKVLENTALTETAIILHRVISRNNLNQEVYTWEADDDEEPYPARAILQNDTSQGGEQDFGSRNSITGEVKYIIKLPWNTDVNRYDRILMNEDTFEILSTNGDHTDRLLMNCACNRLDNVSS